jgi:serine/threonine protein kinase
VSTSDDISESSVTDREIKGSPYWMAPEVVNGQGAGKPSDVWSLGCCIIEMITGQPPWIQHGVDAKRIMQVIKTSGKPPSFPTGITDVCRDFLKYCFILDINKRVSIDELFHHPFVMINDLETIQKSQATSSHLVNSLTTNRF